MTCLEVITGILVIITGWYAISTHLILKRMKDQSTILLKTAQILAFTALMNAAGHRTGEQPIQKLRTLAKELDDMIEINKDKNAKG
jgi:hypothetical protein